MDQNQTHVGLRCSGTNLAELRQILRLLDDRVVVDSTSIYHQISPTDQQFVMLFCEDCNAKPEAQVPGLKVNRIEPSSFTDMIYEKLLTFERDYAVQVGPKEWPQQNGFLVEFIMNTQYPKHTIQICLANVARLNLSNQE